MILARAPYRVSFFGGGTDYPEWFHDRRGVVLSAAVDYWCWATVRWLPVFWPERHRVVWREVERVSSTAMIRHPAIRAVLDACYYNDDRKVEVRHAGDLPARSGMGSSSAFIVALILSLLKLKGFCVLNVKDLAKLAIEIERGKMGEAGGWQDQIVTAYGGFNVTEFCGDGFTVSPVGMPWVTLQTLASKLMLVWTGLVRDSPEMSACVARSIKEHPERFETQVRLVDEARQALREGELDEFGKMLHVGWCNKREHAEGVTCAAIDDLYAAARDAGAMGGKLLGSGGGGFFLLYVPEWLQDKVREALPGCIHVPFRFSMKGAHVAYDGREG